VSEFLAEARVLVLPDTTKFAATLKAELETIAKASAITVPVIAAPVGAGAAAARGTQTVLRREIELTGAAAAGASAGVGKFAKAQTLAATAAQKLAFAQAPVVDAASALGAAQITATRSSAAFAAAQKANTAALAAESAQLQAATAKTLGLAGAQRAEASTALAAARTQAAHASSLGFVSRGAGATGLSLLGVRGATLAANKEFLAGAAAIAIFAKSVGIAASFEQELNVFRVTAGATADEMDRVGQAAKELGADITLPSVSAGDAAAAMTELAKAGLSVQDSIAGARGVLQLATAAQIDNATATNIAASALNAFGLGGEQAVHVADLLANAANEAQGGIADMGGALANVASVSRQVGISLTDTVALLTLLAKNGIQGASAGTVLRVALLRLVAPSTAAAKIIKDLGIRIRDAQGNIRPQVFADFAKATENLSAKQRDADAAIVFGARGIRAAAIFGREGAAAFNEMAIAVDRSGTASEIAGARTEGFSGQVNALKSNLETLGISLGTLAIGPLSVFLDNLNTGIGFLNDFADGLERVGKIKIPPITIGIGFKFKVPGTGGTVGSVVGRLIKEEISQALLGATTLVIAPPLPLIIQGKRIFDALSGGAKKAKVDVEKLSQAFAEQGSILKDNKGFIQEVADRLGRFPTEKELRFIVNADDARKALDKVVEDARKAGTLSAAALAENFRRESQAVAGTLTEPLQRGLRDFVQAAEKAGDEGGKKLVKAFNDAQIRGQLQAQRTAVSRAQAFGGTGLAELEAELARIDRVIAKAERRGTRGPRLQGLFDERRSVINQIASINASFAAETKKKADEIKSNREKADQAIIDSLEVKEAPVQNLILRAQRTKSLRDDIKFAKQLRDIINQQIQVVRNSVKDVQKRAAEIRRLILERTKAENDIRNLQRQQREQAAQDREARLARQDESVQLDIELAQITKNRAAEIRAHNARIKLLQQRIRNAKGNQLEIKRLRVEIAREKAALKDLKGEVDDRGKAFKELTFSFLQTQQGFAANLLGNLIPGGATGGLVGGGAAQGLLAPQFTPGAAIEKEAAVSGARERGVSSGQGSTQIQLLRSILRTLQNIHGRAGHPEARYQKATSGSTMDVL